MFDEPLPKQADLRKLAHRQAHFKACLNAASMPRLAGAVAGGEGTIEVDLHLGVDEQHHRYLRGTVDCNTQVVCQRCMQPMPIQVHSDINLGIVWDDDQARQLPKSMEPIIVGEDELVDLNEVVEDELLLSMPFVSYHEAGECSGKQRYESTSAEVRQALEAEKQKNPFNVLKQLKQKD